jgi:hypothetical protein
MVVLSEAEIEMHRRSMRRNETLNGAVRYAPNQAGAVIDA